MLFFFWKVWPLPSNDNKFDNTLWVLKMIFSHVKFQIIMILIKKTQNYTKLDIKNKKTHFLILFSFLGNVFIEKTLDI